MDFFDNVVKSSNALIKERLNNPFGNKQQQQESTDATNIVNSSTTNDPQHNQSKNSASQDANADQTATTADPIATTNADTTTTTTASQSNAKRSSTDDNDQRRGSIGSKNQFAAIAADAEVVTQKAVKGAKDFGNFLFSMANRAGQTVSQTAKQVKQVVENTSILTDLTREQQEFIKEHGGTLQAGELPWQSTEDGPIDENMAADMREQILSLSQDKRNFVRSPPGQSDFLFDAQKSYPVALSLLKEDPNLGKMRFELVPKFVSEDAFWRNYFYRVEMLKQMSKKGADLKQGWASSRSSSGEGPDEITSSTIDTGQNEYDNSSSKSKRAVEPVEEFANNLVKESLDFDTSASSMSKMNEQRQPQLQQQTSYKSTTDTSELESSESRKLVAEADDLKSKLRELNIGSLDGGDQDDNNKWEEELQRDLQDFELVSGDVSALDEEALNKEIMELQKSTDKRETNR